MLLKDKINIRYKLFMQLEELSELKNNCGEMDNLCLKCGGLYFQDEKDTRGIYTHCCHNGNIIEQASVYPVRMKELMDSSSELSVHFKIT
ncbi:hypothetical protein AVEN_135028-1 [Araneus ventricosus]|uniref:Uncharacterized protein n=1 Tax=Araneus ventricosus TaxID=182803 RepID=A0A4Y2VVB8_ARAVE|nr:hypothetical protein AVEN_135028-1 [Araneus ventricosus]